MARKLYSYMPPAESEEAKDYREKLERSREWLKEWKARQADAPVPMLDVQD